MRPPLLVTLLSLATSEAGDEGTGMNVFLENEKNIKIQQKNTNLLICAFSIFNVELSCKIFTPKTAVEYEDWWPRSGIQENILVHLVNIRHNCSLKLGTQTYPAK